MNYYKDLREYINALDKNGFLWRIKSPVKKETELMPVVRWQFRGLEEEKRRAFLFENVTDQKGRKYDIPVLVGALASSTDIFAMGLMCQPKQIYDKWTQARLHPIPPKLVQVGSVQEVVHVGKELTDLGLEEFPIPVSCPGFSGLVRFTDSHFFSKDPETGIQNIGCYSGYVLTRDRMMVGIGPTQHMAIHLRKAHEKVEPLPVALVTGMVPAIAFVSGTNLPYGVDELTVAGGLAGEAIEVVKCKTVDLEVPAAAEIVIEGRISTTVMARCSGSFGEFTGYMGEPHVRPIFDISCITHRKNPIFTAIIQEMPPNEGNKIKEIGSSYNLLRFLQHDCNIPGILDVALHESSGSSQYCVIQLKKRHPSEVWQALNAAVSYDASLGKIFVAVDDDINPRDADSVNWALSFRMQPHRDTRIIMGKVGLLDPSVAPPGSSRKEHFYPEPSGVSALLIDATRKWDYPPISLPKREYMERAREIWETEGLPELEPKVPWFGYSLGYWPDECQEAAELVERGEVLTLGERTCQEIKEFQMD
jgi:4-hydroxy-3-polyprenylbenzoate decarboxylase